MRTRDTSAELDRAYAIVRTVRPKARPDYACMLVASALAGMRGLTMRHIRVGSLFWPAKFAKLDPGLSMRGGWGCEAFSHADNKLYLSEPTVDDDGGFNGHTWLEPEPHEVIDLMHDNESSLREIMDDDWKIVGRYIYRPDLERAVKAHWRATMQALIKKGREQA